MNYATESVKFLKLCRIAAYVLAVSYGAELIHAQADASQSAIASAHFDMGAYAVHMPENFFVLVRKNRDIGAIQLTKIGSDGSTYESYFQSDGSGSFTNSHVVKRSGEISIKSALTITHTIQFNRGQRKLWVGKWWFGCMGPSLILMSSHFSYKDEGFEFAPTSVRKISDVDSSDKRLRWFHYDPNNRVTVAVIDLPK